MYKDNQEKFVCVINARIPMLRALNAMGHATAGLAGSIITGSVEYLDYPNEMDGFVSRIARAPYIVLKAKNSNQLAGLRKAADDLNIANNCFVSSMIGGSAAEQIEQTRTACGKDLEYWCIVLYGTKEALSPITKGFSLFKARYKTGHPPFYVPI